MKIGGLLFAIVLLWMLIPKFSIAQNTSNKGTDFWVAYTGHIDGTSSRMYLYITSDVNTSGTINIGATIIPFTVNANQVTAVPIDPLLAYVGSSNTIETNKAIHVSSLKPIVVYAHIFKSSRSAATLVLPTKVLGREYFATAYKQNNGNQAFSEFTIIGVEDNTIVEITPTSDILTSDYSGTAYAANATFTISLNKGEIYQFQSKNDLSGSHIISVAGNSGQTCKPIAVYSGSTWVGFCSLIQSSTSGGDNLYQQLYPITAWGKQFITAPFINKPHDIFRIYFSKDNTNLNVNGASINPPVGGFKKGGYYDFTSSTPNQITANEPISVVQYQISQSCDVLNNNTGNNPPHPGDPEMTILNPVEQTLSKITVYSALRDQTNPPTSITQHFINVIIKDDYIASFKIDGSIPQAAFVSIAGSGYSYLQENVTASSNISPTHILEADGGFSAIAYGYGSFESYGYLAGADAKNLYQNIELEDKSTAQTKIDACVNEEVQFALTLPYITNSITWVIDNVGSAPISNPPYTQAVINNVSVYKYKFSQSLTYNTAGAHDVKAIVINPNPSGCDPNEEVELKFEAYNLPTAKFNAVNSNCVNSAITFTDQSISNTEGKSVKKWLWDFSDPNATTTNPSTSTLQNPTHFYTIPGVYTVKLSVQTESGCVSDVFERNITINPAPVAQFTANSNSCINTEILISDQSHVSTGNIVAWSWDMGDGTPVITKANNLPFKYLYNTGGVKNIKLTVVTDKNCQSAVFSKDVNVYDLPVADFDLPETCLNDPLAIFTNQSESFDAPNNQLTYLWDFGDPNATASNPNTSTDKNGKHSYTNTGFYQVSLTVFTPNGCKITKTKIFTVNGASPTANFEVINAASLCSNNGVVFKNTSTVGFGKVTKLEWYFDYLNNPTAVEVDDNPEPNKLYTHNYPAFGAPLNKPIHVKLVAYTGGICKQEIEKTIYLLAAPTVVLNDLPSVCINDGTILLTQGSEANNKPGTGIYSGNGISSTGLFDPKIAGIGTHIVTYTYTSNGCSDAKSKTIEVKQSPVANAGEDIIMLVGGVKRLQANASGQNLTFKWVPSAGLNHDDILAPDVSPDQDTEYTLLVTSSNGCTATDKVFVKVLQDLKPPNSFTPNGDNINDTWNIQYLDSYPNATVEIFTRGGEKIFFSNGYANPFDGNYKNQPLPVGTYYYIITPKNGRKAISGSLTLLR